MGRTVEGQGCKEYYIEWLGRQIIKRILILEDREKRAKKTPWIESVKKNIRRREKRIELEKREIKRKP